MRKTLFKWHSAAALFALIPLMIIAITGSILVFKVEIDTWLMPEHMTVNVASNAKRVPMDELIHTVESEHRDYIIGSWELFDDGTRSDAAYLIRKSDEQWHKLYVNQYDGSLLSQPVSVTHDLTDWLLSLHYTFLLETFGTVLGFVFAVLLLFLAISGIILYRQFWKRIFTLRFNAAKRILFSDVHKFIGITSAPVLLALAFTGLYWNASEVIHDVVEHGEEHAYFTEKAYSEHINFQHILDQAASHIDGFKWTYLTFPFEAEREIHLFGDVPNKNILSSEYSSVITYSKESGEVLSEFDIRTAAAWPTFVDMFRKLHFGYFAGLTTKIIWCVLGLSPFWLALTGFYLYWFRVRPNRVRSRDNATANGKVTA